MATGPSSEDVTALLAATGRGDAEASRRLFSVIYDELHRLASGSMRRERPDHTLQPTALVNEAYLRLLGPGSGDAGGTESGEGSRRYENRAHFIASAAVAMRRILVNHAKARAAAKRGGGCAKVALDDAAAAFDDRAIDLIALNDALEKLAERDPEQARLVELRFFGGMSMEECADVLGVSTRTAHSEWSHARAWLRGQLEGA